MRVYRACEAIPEVWVVVRQNVIEFLQSEVTSPLYPRNLAEDQKPLVIGPSSFCGTWLDPISLSRSASLAACRDFAGRGCHRRCCASVGRNRSTAGSRCCSGTSRETTSWNQAVTSHFESISPECTLLLLGHPKT